MSPPARGVAPARPPAPQVIAHRGASAEAPENTAAAFRRALAIGVDGVELDAHLSADGMPVVIHDHVLDRTTDGWGPVGGLSLAELRRLDAGRWFGESYAGEHILTLAEALDLLRGVRVIVEIKNAPVAYPGVTERVAAVIRESGHPAVTVSSFDHPVLVEMKTQMPSLETAVLYVARPVNPLRLAQDAGAAVLHPHWAMLTRDLVTSAHAAGLRVETWVVDEPEDLRRIVAMGPDGVMTNRAERLRAVLAGLGYLLPRPAGS